MEPKQLIRRILVLLNFVGVNPRNQTRYSKIQFVTSEIVIGILIVEMLLKCVYEWEGYKSMRNLALIPGVCQVLLKISVLYWNWTKLYKLLGSIQLFWVNNPNEITHMRGVKNLLALIGMYMKAMLLMLTMITLFSVAKPITSGARLLFVETYHPRDLHKSPDYEIMCCIQFYVVIFGVPSLAGFDLLFVSLLLLIACELKILTKKFSNIQVDRNSSDDSLDSYYFLSGLIKHHNYVLKCIKDLNEIYNFYLLNVYIINVMCICIGLLSIVISGFLQNWEETSLYASYALFYVLQLFFYSFGGSYLITESERLSDAIYECDWWIKTQPQFRRACAFVIQRSNKTEKLTAGNVFTLNLENFTKIMRTSLSFFTILQAFYSEKK